LSTALRGQWIAMEAFADRTHAGRVLGAELAPAAAPEVVVLGLPRGGVPVAAAVAVALRAPLDVLLVRKLGVPGAPELAFGALASGGVRVLNPDVVAAVELAPAAIEEIVMREAAELTRRERRLRRAHDPVAVAGRPVIIVDDGLATGATMRAAIAAVRARGAEHVTAAAPVGARESVARLERVADAVVCCLTPDPFGAVGRWYEDFSELSDDAVADLLAHPAARRA
jgi:predicted phosphoribosyltransferase